MDERFEKRTYKGGKKEIKVFKKYHLIRTHTGRRSFATNAVLSGIPPSKVMLITGHTTEKMLQDYVKIESKSNAFELFNEPLFKQ